MPHINDKLEEVKALLSGISEDAQKVLSLAQMSIPVAESVIRRIGERVEQAKDLFASEKTNEPNG